MGAYILIAGVLSLVGMWVSSKLKRKFARYSKVPLDANISGAEVAQRMLDHYNLRDVKIEQGKGFLTDHYNPLNKTVTLSPQVYQGQNVAAAAVAAHESGHAVQHAEAYLMLQVRSGLVPVVKVASVLQQYLLIAAFLLANTFPNLLLIVIISFAVTTLFSLVTLPVEFDASRRALAWLDQSGVARGATYEGAKDSLKWAAMTYVAAALSSLVMLLYLFTRYRD